MKLSMNFWFLLVYENYYSTVVYGGNIIVFSLFWSTINNYLEAWLFYKFICMPHEIFWWHVGPCNADLFKLGTVLTYAFNVFCRSQKGGQNGHRDQIGCQLMPKIIIYLPINGEIIYSWGLIGVIYVYIKGVLLTLFNAYVKTINLSNHFP